MDAPFMPMSPEVSMKEEGLDVDASMRVSSGYWGLG